MKQSKSSKSREEGVVAEDTKAMSNGEALQEIGKFKNIFRAAEQIEGVLLAVSQAEGRKAEIDKEISDLEDRAKSARYYVDGSTAALDAKKKELDDYTKDLDAKKKAAKDKFDADMAQLSEHYSLASVAARDKVAEEIKAEQAKVDELTAKKSDLQRDIRMLQAEKAALERSVRPPAGAV